MRQCSTTTRTHRTIVSAAAAAALSLFLVAGLRAQASGDLLVRVKAQGSVSQVASRLKKAVSDNGLMVMGHLNQGKVLGMTGAAVTSESFFIGNPQVGKKLFGADRGVGVVVPPRVNIYRDSQGQTYISYLRPSAELGAFGNENIDKVATMLDKKLAAIARAAAS
ncbi:MAG TPA: DUF302 domain-containing protein [Gemmatimonadota bacterium]|nr:DUF302 domain-containing protein [Gemmatimonadota bacterium]